MRLVGSEMCIRDSFGVGARAYGDDFNGCAREVHELLERLGGKSASRLGLGDTSSATPVEAQLDAWARGLARRLKRKEDAAAAGAAPRSRLRRAAPSFFLRQCFDGFSNFPNHTLFDGVSPLKGSFGLGLLYHGLRPP